MTGHWHMHEVAVCVIRASGRVRAPQLEGRLGGIGTHVGGQVRKLCEQVAPGVLGVECDDGGEGKRGELGPGGRGGWAQQLEDLAQLVQLCSAGEQGAP